MMLDPIRTEAQDFYQFLMSTNVIQIGTGFIIATQINKIASSFIDSFVSPIIDRLFMGKGKDFEDIQIDIFGAKIRIGEFVNTILKFIVTIVIVYYVIKLTIGIKKN